ncbi:hypothetical protein Q0N76_18235 [Bacillus altitudinis]
MLLSDDGQYLEEEQEQEGNFQDKVQSVLGNKGNEDGKAVAEEEENEDEELPRPDPVFDMSLKRMLAKRCSGCSKSSPLIRL